ncbi:MAG: hypothetical protein WCL30_03045 [Pseudomonadota bacterium]
MKTRQLVIAVSVALGIFSSQGVFAEGVDLDKIGTSETQCPKPVVKHRRKAKAKPCQGKTVYIEREKLVQGPERVVEKKVPVLVEKLVNHPVYLTKETPEQTLFFGVGAGVGVTSFHTNAGFSIDNPAFSASGEKNVSASGPAASFSISIDKHFPSLAWKGAVPTAGIRADYIFGSGEQDFGFKFPGSTANPLGKLSMGNTIDLVFTPGFVYENWFMQAQIGVASTTFWGNGNHTVNPTGLKTGVILGYKWDNGLGVSGNYSHTSYDVKTSQGLLSENLNIDSNTFLFEASYNF